MDRVAAFVGLNAHIVTDILDVKDLVVWYLNVPCALADENFVHSMCLC